MPDTTTVAGRDITVGDSVSIGGQWHPVREVLGGDMFCGVLTDRGRITVKPGLHYQIKRSQAEQ